MSSVTVYLRSDNPEASYREVVERLLSVWLQRVPPEVAARVRDALGPWTDSEGETIDPLVDGGVAGLVINASLLDPSLRGEAAVQISCRAIYGATDEPDESPTRIGRAIDVVLHPVPTIGGPDLSGVVTLTALAVALGAEPVEREGWLWALSIPGTSWVIGRPDAPRVVYGLGRCEKPMPADEEERSALEAAERERLERAHMLAGALV